MSYRNFVKLAIKAFPGAATISTLEEVEEELKRGNWVGKPRRGLKHIQEYYRHQRDQLALSNQRDELASSMTAKVSHHHYSGR